MLRIFDLEAAQVRNPIRLHLLPGAAPGNLSQLPLRCLLSWRLVHSWQLGFTIPITKPEYLKWNFDFPRPETVTQFSLIPDPTYNKIQRIRLTFPGNTAQAPLEFAVQPTMARQDFPVPNIQASGVTLELITETQGKVPVTGIRNLWIKVQRSDDFKQKVQPLLSIGVLNKYPTGKGGILLNEMQPKDGDLFIHHQQKIILGVLLRNLLDKPQ